MDAHPGVEPLLTGRIYPSSEGLFSERQHQLRACSGAESARPRPWRAFSPPRGAPPAPPGFTALWRFLVSPAACWSVTELRCHLLWEAFLVLPPAPLQAQLVSLLWRCCGDLGSASSLRWAFGGWGPCGVICVLQMCLYTGWRRGPTHSLPSVGETPCLLLLGFPVPWGHLCLEGRVSFVPLSWGWGLSFHFSAGTSRGDPGRCRGPGGLFPTPLSASVSSSVMGGVNEPTLPAWREDVVVAKYQEGLVPTPVSSGRPAPTCSCKGPPWAGGLEWTSWTGFVAQSMGCSSQPDPPASGTNCGLECFC